MSFSPFSNSELEFIKKALNGQGWVQKNRTGNQYRYSIDPRDRIVSMALEHEIPSPLKTHKYMPLARVKFGILASIGMIRDDLLQKLMTFWGIKVKEIEPILSQIFTFEEFKNLASTPDMKNKIMSEFLAQLPDVDDKDENVFYQRLRLSLANSKHVLDYNITRKITEALSSLKIMPTMQFDEVLELKDGIPITLVDQVLVYKNPDYYEVVFLEPGYFVYFRDFEIENVKMRLLIDSIAMNVLYNTWKVDLASLVSNLIKAARLAFSAALNYTGISEFKKVYFIQKNLDLLLKKHIKEMDALQGDPSAELVFPYPNLWFDTVRSSTLSVPVWNVFIKPPETFDELQARRVYLDSQKQSKQGRFGDTITPLSATLAVFNKAGQKYAFFLVLVELARIATKLNNYDECKGKYQLAIDFALKTENLVNPDELVVIQEEYAMACVRYKDLDNAIRQLTILFNYLERARPETDSKRIDILLKLNKIYIERHDFASLESEIQDYFKKIKDFADKHKDKIVLSHYYRVLGLFWGKKGKDSTALDAFRKGLSETQSLNLVDVQIDIILDIGRIYLYGKKKNLQAAERYLLQGNEIVGRTDNLLRELYIYEMLQDLYTQMDNMELAGHFNKESQRLRVALRSRGEL